MEQTVPIWSNTIHHNICALPSVAGSQIANAVRCVAVQAMEMDREDDVRHTRRRHEAAVSGKVF
jgi:hypothetical protein